MSVSKSSLSIGDSKTMVVVDNLTRSQIVMYAGASGDYNPLHTDEIFATQVAGYPSVFAHGMLTMGATGRLVTDWFGPENVAYYGVRFVNQVWPGDTLTVTATVVSEITEESGQWLATIGVETVNQHGAVVVSGTAKVTLA